MLDAHQHATGGHWNKYDNQINNRNGISSIGSNFGLVFLLAILMGMAFYIGSFYWNREPLPKVSKKQKPAERESHSLPLTFDKNLG